VDRVPTMSRDDADFGTRLPLRGRPRTGVASEVPAARRPADPPDDRAPLDAAQTRLALETDPAPTDARFPSTNQKAFHYAYSVNLAGGGTVACMRTVIVEFAPDPQGYFRGVHNSYQGAEVNP
jgi:hypothetical protein